MTYLIVDWTEVDLIDFSQIIQHSKERLRKSLDGTKFVIKWNEQTPDFLDNLTTKSPEYTHEEILEIMGNNDWTDPNIKPPGVYTD